MPIIRKVYTKVRGITKINKIKIVKQWIRLTKIFNLRIQKDIKNIMQNKNDNLFCIVLCHKMFGMEKIWFWYVT